MCERYKNCKEVTAVVNVQAVDFRHITIFNVSCMCTRGVSCLYM
jgi:hypothetical protein